MTISFSQLGNMGHAGNQMFQYAALRGIAAKHGYDWAIPPKHEFGRHYPMRSSIYDIFELPQVQIINTIIPTSNTPMMERQFHFDSELFETCTDNVDLNGYFQSYKYFEHIHDELIEEFSFKSDTLASSKDLIAIHVRRGDYVNQPQFHPVCSEEYYKEAMKIFDGEKFIVISDDPEWCSQQEIFSNCTIAINRSVADDLHTMVYAKGNIIANSSFSWWGAYLNNNSTVVCPEKWFGVNYNHYNMNDLRPESWIQL